MDLQTYPFTSDVEVIPLSDKLLEWCNCFPSTKQNKSYHQQNKGKTVKINRGRLAQENTWMTEWKNN